MSRRVQIDRLELDMRGIAPATAEAVGRLLGPALAQALDPARLASVRADRIEAGQIEASGRRDPQGLARQVAGQIVQSLGDRP